MGKIARRCWSIKLYPRIYCIFIVHVNTKQSGWDDTTNLNLFRKTDGLFDVMLLLLLLCYSSSSSASSSHGLYTLSLCEVRILYMNVWCLVCYSISNFSLISLWLWEPKNIFCDNRTLLSSSINSNTTVVRMWTNVCDFSLAWTYITKILNVCICYVWKFSASSSFSYNII